MQEKRGLAGPPKDLLIVSGGNILSAVSQGATPSDQVTGMSSMVPGYLGSSLNTIWKQFQQNAKASAATGKDGG